MDDDNDKGKGSDNKQNDKNIFDEIDEDEKISFVELAIFTTITLVFLNSVYNLFFMTMPDPHQALNKARTELASVKPKTITEKTFEFDCQNTEAFASEPATSKIRLTGNYCQKGRAIASITESDIKQAKIQNLTTGIAATIFNDPETNKYTTDYIQLNEGKNTIAIEFIYRNGGIYSRQFNIQGSK